MNFGRLTRAELVAIGGGILLAISVFLSWFGTKETLDAYRTALDNGDILKWYFNSLVTASVITIARLCSTTSRWIACIR